MKKLGILALFVFSLLSVLVSASFTSQTLQVANVEVNDIDVQLLDQAQITAQGVDARSGVVVDEGEELEVSLTLISTADIENVQVEAEIRGYEYDDYEDISDRVHVFDLKGTVAAPSQKKVNLRLTLPRKLEDDRYLLRITADDKDSPSFVGYVVLQVEPTRHGVDVADVVFSPGNVVKAGRSLLATVLLENYGDKVERDVKVVVEIPALGVRAAEFVDKVDVESIVDTATQRTGSNVEYEDVPEMFLAIPATAEAGEYEVIVRVLYDNLREEIVQKHLVTVVENPMFAPQETGEQRLILAVGPQAQNVRIGETGVYAIALNNEGKTSEAYTLELVNNNWATAALSESLIVLSPGKNKVVYVDVTPLSDAAVGSHTLSVAVKKGIDVLETVTLNANVAAAAEQPQGESISLRNGLEIALIVLVVLLIIIGLIVGFSRLRKDDDEEKTYY